MANSGTEYKVALTLTGDGKSAVEANKSVASASKETRQEVEATNAALDKSADSNQKAAAGAGSARAAIEQLNQANGTARAASAGAASAALEQAAGAGRVAETEAEAAARIRDMVRASVAAKEANGGIELSQRAIAERTRMTAAEIAALNAQYGNAASTQERMRERVDALNAAEQRRNATAAKATTGTNDEAAALEKLLGKIDPTVAAYGRLDKMQDELLAFRRSGALSGDDYAAYAAKLAKARGEVEGTSGALSHLTLNSASARRELGVMAGEIARGDFGSLEGSFLTLANRAGVLPAIFSAVGIAIAALLALVVGYFAAVNAGASTQRQFENDLITSGNAAGTSAGQMLNLKSAIGAATGEYGKAEEALSRLAAGGRVTGDALTSAARGAVALSELTGQSIDQAVSEFERLADDPVKNVVNLNEKYHFLTLAVYEQIKALQDQGNQEAATSLAMQTAADALDRRRQQIVDNAGAIEKAWRGVKTTIAEVIDNFAQLGRTDIEGKLRAAYADRENISDARMEIYGGGVAGAIDKFFGADTRIEKRKAANDALIASLEELRDAQEKADLAAAKQTHAQDNAIRAKDAVDALVLSYDKQAKKQAEIRKLDQDFAAIRAADPSADILTNGTYERALKAIGDRYKENTSAARQHEQLVKQLDAAMAKLTTTNDKAAVGLTELQKEEQRYVQQLRAIAQAGGEAVTASQKLGQGQAGLARIQATVVAELGKAKTLHDQNVRSIGQHTTATEDLVAKMQDELEAVGLSAEARERLNREREVEKALIKDGIDLGSEEAARRRAEVDALGRSIEQHKLYADQVRQQSDRVRGYYESMADALGAAMTRGGNLLKNIGRALVDTLRDIVTQMIQQWLRTQIIGSFMGGGGGGWGGLLSAGMSAIGGGSGGGVNLGGAAMQFGANQVGGSSGFSLWSPSSWMSAGKNLWNGFFGAGNSAAGGTMFGTWSGTGSVTNIAGGGVNLPFGGTGAYTPTPFGYAAGAAGGLYAGYNRWQNSNGGVAGGLGAAAYGIGTAGLIGGLGGMAAGGTFAAGMAGGLGAGAAAGAGMAGMAAAIPVIGWIALIAMIVDMVAGGKLFGTSYRPERAEQRISLGADGPSAGLGISESRQRALFGGKQWRWRELEVPPELQKAAEDFYKTISKIMTDGARKLEIDTPPMIEASLRTVQELDKKGKVKATKYFVDVLGRTWEESSAELAATRVSAEAIVATVAASEAGKAASVIAEQWRDNAEELMAGAQFLLAATSDIVKGRGLLNYGTGADTSAGAPDELTQVADLVDELSYSGEALGDTYARLKADADNLKSALDLMGTKLDKSGADFVRFAAEIEAAAGGLDQANAKWQSFFSSYYSQNELAANQLPLLWENAKQSLVGIGLDAETDMKGFRAAFEEALPTLTPEQIVQWLDAAKALADATNAQEQYTAAIEQQEAALFAAQAQYADFVAGLAQQAGELGDFSAFDAARLQIEAWKQQTIAQANAGARAAGLAGASEQTLALIRRIAARQTAQLIDQLRAQVQSEAQLLGYFGRRNTDTAANDAVANWGNAAVEQTNRVIEAQRQLYQAQLQGIKGIEDYLVQMQFGDLSGLTPDLQLDEARRQLLDLQARALGGDADAMQALPQMAQQFLTLLRGSEASGADFNAGYDWVRQLLQAVVDRGPTVADPGEPGSVGAGGITRDYLDERDQRIAEQEEFNRKELALQLTQHLGDLAKALNIPVLELANEMKIPLQQLAADLGIDLKTITGASVEALANMATQLGIPLGELVQGLGLTLPDLKAGLVELTTSLGIDLTQLTGTTAGQLAGLAAQLGTNLSTLTQSLGIDLGKLVDINSPIFVALSRTIDTLSPDIKTELQPLLDAVRDAAGDEQKNAAVKALRDHVDEMAPDLKNLLAPYFDDITPADPADQLAYLRGTSEATASMASTLTAARNLLGDIKQYLADANRQAGIPGYAVGSAYIAQDHLAMVHQGEGIVDATSWRVLQRYGIRVATQASNDDTRAVVIELQALKAEVAALRRENGAGQSKIAQIVQDGDAKARSQRDALAGRQTARERSDRYGRA